MTKGRIFVLLLLIAALIIGAVLLGRLDVVREAARVDKPAGPASDSAPESLPEKTTSGDDPYGKLTEEEMQVVRATVSGRIIDLETGRAVPLAVVFARTGGLGEFYWADNASAGLDGSYSFNPLVIKESEQFTVAAWSSEHLMSRKTFEIAPRENLENADVYLSKETDVTITVVSEIDNSPVELDKIEILDENALHSFRAYREGSGYVGLELEKGVYIVKGGAQGYVGLYEFIEVYEKNQSFILKISPGGKVSGTVKTVDGSPIKGATVSCRVPGGLFLSEVSDEKGYYEINGIPPGEVEVMATHPEYADALDTLIRAETGVEKSRDIVMTEGVNVYGIVTGAGGEPVTRARVRIGLDYYHSGLHRETTSDKNGFYKFERVASGNYNFEVSAEGYVPLFSRGHEILEKQGDREFSFELDPGASIKGRAVDSKGKGIPDVKVTVAASGFAGISVKTNKDGFFLARGLKRELRYSVSFIPENYGYRKIDNVEPGANLGKVVLEEYGGLRGKVVLNGNPVPEARVYVWIAGKENKKFSKITDHEGTFIFESLRPGTYDLKVESVLFTEQTFRNILIQEGSRPPDLIIEIER